MSIRGSGDADQAVAHATVNAAGLLMSADPAIAALNLRAGGGDGMPLAVPQLATMARLARRLGIVVSRRVVVADDDQDTSLWVRAQPDGDHVRLAASGWAEMPVWHPAAEPPDALPGDGQWRWEVDAALRLTFLSPGVGNMTDPGALLGRPLSALFGFAEQADGSMPILDALARRTPLKDQPAVLKASGRSVLLSARIRPDAGGEFAGLIGTAREQEDRSSTNRDTALPAGFVAGLDKALRAPLAKIVANADSINAQADGPVTSDYADYAADIAGAGRHLLSLVDDLLDLQTIARPDFRPVLEPIDAADVARRAAGLLTVRADIAGVTIERPSIDQVAPMLADFRRTLQILVNLIGNALRYSVRGGTVGVEVSLAAGRCRVTVSDAGRGIAPEDQARIFDQFERIAPSEPDGSGLGLFIARRLARAMDGDLTVASAPNEGARFTLTLPAGQPPRDQ